MPATLSTYPEFEPQVREFVEQHRRLKKQRLHLAVYFAPLRRNKSDVFLFEVIDGFGGEIAQVDRGDLFEFAYGSTPAFALPEGSSLRMVLTNPEQFREAARRHWKGCQELRAARDAHQAIVIHSDGVGKQLWNLI